MCRRAHTQVLYHCRYDPKEGGLSRLGVKVYTSTPADCQAATVV